MVRLKTQNDLEIALRQNKWLGEILEKFEEIIAGQLARRRRYRTDNLEFGSRTAR
jgi:hypothetical protein